MVTVIILIACTTAAARGKKANDKSRCDDHPSLRTRIAGMC
jgi:hypothetical protein